jgi:magnesium transporter
VSHGDSESGVVASSVYADGRRIKDIAIEEAGEWSKRPGHVVWIGLFEPNTDLLQRAQAQLGLHDLAIEDAGKAHQYPKIEQYGEALFVVARTAQSIDGRIALGETHLFVGRGYVVSVRHGASRSYAAVRERCESCPALLSQGEDYILYAVLDFIVDNYMPVLETLHAEVEGIEDSVFSKPAEQVDVQRLYMIRRDLLRIRNAVVPLVEVCRRLEHAEVMPIDTAMQPLFRDVTDHVLRVQEEIDALREVLAFAFEASPDEGPGAADGHHPKTGGLGRHPRGTDRDRRHLRHELRLHAGAQMELRLFSRDRRDRRHLRLALLAISPKRLDLGNYDAGDCSVGHK